MKIIFVHTLNIETLRDLRLQFPGAEIFIGQATASENTLIGLISTLTFRKIAFELVA